MRSRPLRCATRAEIHKPPDAPNRRVALRHCATWLWTAWPFGAWAQPAAPRPVMASTSLRFGILPYGGALESRDRWTPLLTDMSRAIGRPISVLSVTSYESLDQAIQRNEVDVALLGAKMALDAVVQRRMKVLVQVRRRAGEADHRAVLLVRKDSALNNLAALIENPGRWRMARADSRSVTGFVLPQVQLFLPNRIAIETAFRSEMVGTHQSTALAVANGDADVATNNTTDFERFREQFPIEAARLQVIWKSSPTPAAQVVMRRDAPQELEQKVRAFLVGYGDAVGARGDAERAVLRSLHAGLGYEAVDDTALLPAAELEYQLSWQQAMNAAWVNDAARQARLQRIEQIYAQQVLMLKAPSGAVAGRK